jgi:hypothetical protein
MKKQLLASGSLCLALVLTTTCAAHHASALADDDVAPPGLLVTVHLFRCPAEALHSVFSDTRHTLTLHNVHQVNGNALADGISAATGIRRDELFGGVIASLVSASPSGGASFTATDGTGLVLSARMRRPRVRMSVCAVRDGAPVGLLLSPTDLDTSDVVLLPFEADGKAHIAALRTTIVREGQMNAARDAFYAPHAHIVSDPIRLRAGASGGSPSCMDHP